MKKIILLVLITSVVIACNSSYENSPTISPQKIGIEIPSDSTKFSIYGGDMTTVEIWEKYIKAHNEKDLETIENINDESFKGYPPDGSVIEGSKAHIEFLKDWFTNSSPKWRTKYMISNEFTDDKGTLNQWVTSGQDLTDTINGEEATVHHVHDALFVNGKIKMIYVYERIKAEE